MSTPTGSTAAAGLLALALLAAAPRPAAAYPEGAPWGAANPGAGESCADCHYDYDAVYESDAIVLENFPSTAAAGADYEFILRFLDDTAASSGFQIVVSAEGADAGHFHSADSGVETAANAIRSTRPQKGQDGICWSVNWQAPRLDDTSRADVVFYLAVSSANDDQSPFGDTIHYRQVSVAVDQD